MKFALIIWMLTAGTAWAADPALVIQDPEILSQLEDRGLSLAERLIGQPPTAGHNGELKDRSAAYRGILAEIESDLYQLTRQDKLLGPGMEKSHRLFNGRWMSSPAARYELAGVVNRLDRRPFHPGTCGEVRLIYRLRYSMLSKGQRVTSRLPFTINLVNFQVGSDCDDVAKLWFEARKHLGKDQAAWLTSKSGPLSAVALSSDRLKSLEVNFQSVRWPSTVRPDLGAHAEYLMRVFDYDQKTGAFVPAPLENTIDVDKLSGNGPVATKLRNKLIAWLNEPKHKAAVDQGIVVIPDEFLAKKATSVSPRGLARWANRPFKRVLGAHGFDEGTLRRLDDLSCVGCHQGRSVAGFHFLGIDRADTPSVNAINVTGSPHFNLDLPRRLAFLEAVEAEKPPVDARPLSERADQGEGGYGSHCGLGNPAFKAWTCNAGLKCRALGLAAGDDTVGQCFPESLGEVGDPCEMGTLKPDADPQKDKIVGAKEIACQTGAVCETNQVGFPEGMCATSCEAKAKNSACGAIAQLTPFNDCLGQGKPFPKCLAENVSPAALRACDEATPCRDDYLCARTESGAGACIPPYFLFQMRVDGHPKPD